MFACQSPRAHTQNQDLVSNLIGALTQAAARSKAKKEWAPIGTEVRQCVDLAFARHNLSVDTIINAGVSPSDQRVTPVVEFCKETANRQLRIEVPCSVKNDKGQEVQSLCSERFASNTGRGVTALTVEQYIQAAARGESVDVALFETDAAASARVQSEKQRDEEARLERERFLASPEGRRQAALEAARARQEREQAERAAAAQRAAQAREFPDKAVLERCQSAIRERFYFKNSDRYGNVRELVMQTPSFSFTKAPGTHPYGNNYVFSFTFLTQSMVNGLSTDAAVYQVYCVVSSEGRIVGVERISR